ncbi:PREDICTED: uncharacterized protein LOC107067335 [Polistes dominula]|uniref:Uncharacterized protein LOC107067335 n=1 Tax=Polistes dominula TaxID=743375 RepID=A0ABM1IDF2_POLDO|nr:PREDICTED: uncharacterized protein LOC107067335 [Polistes dominula]
MWNRKVLIRIIEMLLCIACVVALRVTDDESRRVFHYLRNRSREWSLLNNVTWGTIGAALATATCGGYVIITAGLLIAAATNELTGRKMEIFFLGLGIILFGIVGALALASIESIPEDLIDNAAVLGALALITALAFIADLLISPPRKKDKQEVRIINDKDSAKQPTMTTMTTEKEIMPTKEILNSKSEEESKEINGKINEGFEKMDVRGRKENNDEDSDKPQRLESRPYDNYELERNRHFNIVEKELREHSQNFENGRVLRDSQRYREAELLQRSNSGNRTFDDNRRIDDSRIVYKSRDIYQRPVDEIDTPPFPTNLNRLNNEPIFGKIINPSVKIMKIQRDVNEPHDTYRYSDSSQYDNVPVKMRGTSPSILKKDRGISSNGSLALRIPSKIEERSKNEIEMLEECFSSLRSTGTQTGVRTPSSPTDPGYVRHTASNWPQDVKAKTPGSSPEHNGNQ